MTDIEEKWKTQDFHIYRPKTHTVVEAEWMYSHVLDPETQLIQQEEEDEQEGGLQRALSCLTEEERNVVQLRYYSEEGQKDPLRNATGRKTFKSIAYELGLTPARVFLVHRRALLKLKQNFS